jgi:hypothetical protein
MGGKERGLRSEASRIGTASSRIGTASDVRFLWTGVLVFEDLDAGLEFCESRYEHDDKTR